ncbi:hypothetical protein D3C84_1209400 [compost metagenome]
MEGGEEHPGGGGEAAGEAGGAFVPGAEGEGSPRGGGRAAGEVERGFRGDGWQRRLRLAV